MEEEYKNKQLKIKIMKGIEILQKKCDELNIEFDYNYSPKR